MILYHIMADTGCLPDDVVPQIPTNRMKGEDQEIPRICLGHTLDDCLQHRHCAFCLKIPAR